MAGMLLPPHLVDMFQVGIPDTLLLPLLADVFQLRMAGMLWLPLLVDTFQLCMEDRGVLDFGRIRQGTPHRTSPHTGLTPSMFPQSTSRKVSNQ